MRAGRARWAEARAQASTRSWPRTWRASASFSHPLIVVGPLVPVLWPDLLEERRDPVEVHECLTVETPWAGPLTVDVTWSPPAVAAGLSGTTAWSGEDDMVTAVPADRAYAGGRERLRERELALRSRLYRGDQAQRRDRLLAVIAERASAAAADVPSPTAR